MHVVSVISPIFLIIALGYALRGARVVRGSMATALNSFVYFVALPAIIVASFWRVDWRDAETLSLVGANMALLLVFAGILFVVLTLLYVQPRTKAAFFMAAIAGNTVYMGFPLAERAVGAGKFASVTAAAAAHLVLAVALSVLVAKFYSGRRHGALSYLRDFFVNPPMLSLIAGVALSLLGASGGWFDVVRKAVEMLEQTASPLALFALGVFVHGKFSSSHRFAAALAASVKLAALPAFVYVLAGNAGIADSAGMQASVLLAAMPTAVTTFVIAEKHKLDTALIANAILIGTALSVGTLSAVLALAR